MPDMQSQMTVPVEQVRSMLQQGMGNNQIIQALQRDGYSSSQIFDAISQASGDTPLVEDFPNIAQNVQGGYPPGPGQEVVYPNEEGSTSTEELIESIIDEKWNELLKDITKIVDWKNEVEGKFQAMQIQLKDTKGQMERVQGLIMGKISEYDKNILDVGADVKAMEKAFSKFLPVFAESVSELSRITDNLKAYEGRKGKDSQAKKN